MGNLFHGPTPWILLFIVLLLFGAPKLPALAKSLGQSMKILKKEVTTKDEAGQGEAPGSDQAPAAPAASQAPAEPTVRPTAAPVAPEAPAPSLEDELARARAEAEAAKAEAEALRAAAEKRADPGQ